ncbi:unnamed protein product, partial [Didymodactylos carnosus]
TVINDIVLESDHKRRHWYYIVSGNDNGLFSINDNGQLFVTSQLNISLQTVYFDLTVLIHDGLQEYYCQTQIQIIKTRTWNNFVCPKNTFEWSINEEVPLDTVIGSIMPNLIEANNVSRNNHLNMKQINDLAMTLSGKDSYPFKIDQQTGVLSVIDRLDYETQATYLFNILLNPRNNEPLINLNCNLTLLLHLFNINDNIPQFQLDSLQLTVNENNRYPLYIGRVKASDADDKNDHHLNYYLLNNTNSDILVDKTTGSIILFKTYDRELISIEHFLIMVQDNNSNESLNSTGILTINVNDLNDQPPIFDKQMYEMNISETTKLDSVVLQVVASSRDPVSNGNITYSIINNNSNISYFKIDSNTGMIKLIKPLDYEHEKYISFIVEAIEENMSQNIQNTTQTIVHIYILDENDNYPHFFEHYDCELNENLLSQNICTINAFDQDNGNYLTYHLEDPNNNFNITLNGTIYNLKMFDYELDEIEQNVTVIVSDNGQPISHNSTFNITIHIKNLNDNSPQFEKKALTLIYFSYPSVNTTLYNFSGMCMSLAIGEGKNLLLLLIK